MVKISLAELLKNVPVNKTIGDNLIKAYNIVCDRGYKKILCSVSGGSDSDVMIDILTKMRDDIDYVWFDTGLEYKATKEHLTYLEEKYHINIERIRAIKPIPVSCKEYGQPFMSKHTSEMMSRLQRHGFEWEDKPYEILIEKYPDCLSALKWWCNKKAPAFCIKQNKFLKEFIICNPPTFRVSCKCCDFAKKDISHNLIKERGYDLNIVGVRKSEGGVRATQYKSCFDDEKACANYRPLFWYTNKDKEEYQAFYEVINSRCYTEYGLTRTGCVGCPYGRNLEFELMVLEKFEPNLYKAACNVFKDSYEYTRQYREFARQMKMKDGGQLTIDDYIGKDIKNE